MSEMFETISQERGLEELTLSANGLRVLLLRETSAPVVAACLVYHVGSRNEAVGHTGSTHLLEHLLFKGSARFDPAQGRPIARTLERVGASFNATTWFDRTSYYETLPPEHLELALELEADRMRHALLRPEDLAAELTVVRNELARGENDPFDVLLKESFAVAFREHPYHHPTIGWKSDVEHATLERLRQFYDSFYYPDNATLVVAGALERQETLDLIARHYGPLPRAPRPIPPVVTQESPQEGERRFIIRRAAEVGWVALSWRGQQAAHPDTHALAVLADGLAGGVTSRLYQRLVEEGKCLNVQALCWQLRDPGLFQVFATLNPPARHEEVERCIRAEVERIAEEGFSAQELERAKVQVEAQTAYHRDSPAQIAAGLSEAVAAADWRFYLDYLSCTQAVTQEDVQRVARAYLVEDAISVGYFVPRGNGGGAVGAGFDGARALLPRPCHWRTQLASQVEQVALPGGARALLLPRHFNPTVHVQGSFLAGHGMLPPAEWSAASVLPEMVERGTRRFSRLELAQMVEDRGIELDVSGETFNPLEVFFSGRCLARHSELLFELLIDQLRAPTLPEEELEKVRQLRLGELAQSQEDTFTRAFEAFSRLTYPPGHPYYRRPLDERRRSLQELDQAGLVSAHGRLYGPGSLVLAVVGDFEPVALRAHLAQLLAAWEGGVTSS
ncbi:MAG: insulinase family protein, partial [Acidobacteriota bacterium]